MRFLAKKQLLHSISRLMSSTEVKTYRKKDMLRGGAEFTVLFPMVSIEVQSSLVKALINC